MLFWKSCEVGVIPLFCRLGNGVSVVGGTPKLAEHCGLCGVPPRLLLGLRCSLFLQFPGELSADASQLSCSPELAATEERHLAQGYVPSPGAVLIQSLSSGGVGGGGGKDSLWGTSEGLSQLQSSSWSTLTPASALKFACSLCPVFPPSAHTGCFCQGSPITCSQKPQCLSLFPRTAAADSWSWLAVHRPSRWWQGNTNSPRSAVPVPVVKSLTGGKLGWGADGRQRFGGYSISGG